MNRAKSVTKEEHKCTPTTVRVNVYLELVNCHEECCAYEVKFNGRMLTLCQNIGRI